MGGPNDIEEEILDIPMMGTFGPASPEPIGDMPDAPVPLIPTDSIHHRHKRRAVRKAQRRRANSTSPNGVAEAGRPPKTRRARSVNPDGETQTLKRKRRAASSDLSLDGLMFESPDVKRRRPMELRNPSLEGLSLEEPNEEVEVPKSRGRAMSVSTPQKKRKFRRASAVNGDEVGNRLHHTHPEITVEDVDGIFGQSTSAASDEEMLIDNNPNAMSDVGASSPESQPSTSCPMDESGTDLPGPSHVPGRSSFSTSESANEQKKEMKLVSA
ncbi:hypothetical protein QR680_002959 [Steinernema hermaphroditum]|uniref:Uncharacterized protein n=1 Tax=Steinernema hermaphroditum TaxID=289476 RepID=A0AA39H701_9BILA|nr:hypothetical protein QR680_002959 [Steinernema hermaphroditum]